MCHVTHHVNKRYVQEHSSGERQDPGMSRLYITDNDAQHKAKVGNYGRRKVIGKGLSKRQA